MAIKDYVGLAAWGPTFEHVGDFSLLRLGDFDWCRSASEPHYFFDRGWFSVTFALLGCCVSITYWPKGKLPLPSLADLEGGE